MRVRIMPHNKAWESQYEAEKNLLAAALGDALVEAHHIGSTAVPGLPAVPVIDLMLVVSSLDALEAARDQLAQAGYERVEDPTASGGVLMRKYVQTSPDDVYAQAFVFPANDTYNIQRHLAVRDYLRAHKSAAGGYANLKRMIARQNGRNYDAYCRGKKAFMQQLERSART